MYSGATLPVLLFQERISEKAQPRVVSKVQTLCITQLNCPLQLMAALPVAWLIVPDVCFILAAAAAVLY